MAKPFSITIDVELAWVGKTVRALNAMPGVSKLHFDLDEEKKKTGANGAERGPYKPRKQPVTLEETGEESVAKALHGKPPMTTAQLRDVFTSQGRSAASISSVLHKMRKSGELQTSPDGWSLSKKMRDRMRWRKATKKKGK